MLFKLNEELGKVVPPEHCDLIHTHERLQEEVPRLKQDKEQMRMEFAAEKRELVEEIGVLQDENQKYLDTIIKHSKKNAQRPEKHSRGPRELKTDSQVNSYPITSPSFRGVVDDEATKGSH
jgi:hypothetical protein